MRLLLCVLLSMLVMCTAWSMNKVCCHLLSRKQLLCMIFSYFRICLTHSSTISFILTAHLAHLLVCSWHLCLPRAENCLMFRSVSPKHLWYMKHHVMHIQCNTTALVAFHLITKYHKVTDPLLSLILVKPYN